jgi:hypothetical protein
MVYAVLGFYALTWCWYRCPAIGTSSIVWAQLSTFYLTTETESSLRNVVFCNISRTVFLDNTGRWIMSRNIIFVVVSSSLYS